MSIENLVNIVRLGQKLTPAQSRAVSAQLERIPAMERTLAAKDRDFTQLSIAYTAAIEAGKSKGVQFTADECQFVCEALEQCERLKDAVRWMLEYGDFSEWIWPQIGDDDGEWALEEELSFGTIAARKAVEELL